MSNNQAVAPQVASLQSAPAPILLVNVCRYYEPNKYPHQKNSLEWLQKQLSSAVLTEFFQRWNDYYGRKVPTLREGDRGEAVKELQRILNNWGANLVADGVFGANTKTAVIKFQGQRGLMMDGIVGQKTWAELLKPSQTIRISDMFRAYDPTRYAYQTLALDWLQKKITTAVLTEFAKRWRNQVQ